MRSIIVIHPYFGKFPDMFSFWLESCKLNESVVFLIVTDQEISTDATNIIVYKSNLKEIKSRIENICGFPVWLEKPYKLCDFRPLFGHIFDTYTSKYDFWGYCDCDLIFGDIRHFLSEEVLDNYDYILGWGHFHIQRTNDPKFDGVWRSARGLWRNIGWKGVFQSEKNEWFDELPYGVSGRYYELYPERCWMGYSNNHACFESPALSRLPFMSLFNEYNLWSRWQGFQDHLKRLPFLNRDKGGDIHNIIYRKVGAKLYAVGNTDSGAIINNEILYAHFYKRNLAIYTRNLKHYCIRPNAIVNDFVINNITLRYNANHPSIYFNYCLYRICRKISTIKNRILVKKFSLTL